MKFDDFLDLVGNGDLASVLPLVRESPELLASRSRRGMTPLIMAVKMGRIDVVKLLLDHGANPNQQTDLVSPISGRVSKGVVPLSFAYSAALVGLLVAAGGDVNAVDGNGRSILRQVGLSFDVDAVKELVALGAVPTIQDLKFLASVAEEELAYRKSANSNSSKREGLLEDFIEWCKCMGRKLGQEII